jgi:acetyl esterase/lipase
MKNIISQRRSLFPVCCFLICIALVITEYVFSIAPPQKNLSTFESDIRVERDVDYLGLGRNEKLDIYYPSGPKPADGYPAVIVIHGGGFWTGDKGDEREQQIAKTVASAGYFAVSINYKLASKKDSREEAFPQNIYDCKKAVMWLKNESDRYGINKNLIGAVGGSAGGWLSLCLGFTSGDPGFDPADAVDTRINAVVNLYGSTDLVWYARKHGDLDKKKEEELKKFSPTYWVTSNSPPVLTIHATNDKIVDIGHAYQLDKAMKKYNVSHELIVIEGGRHSFRLLSELGDFRDEVVRFLDNYLKCKENNAIHSDKESIRADSSR